MPIPKTVHLTPGVGLSAGHKHVWLAHLVRRYDPMVGRTVTDATLSKCAICGKIEKVLDSDDTDLHNEERPPEQTADQAIAGLREILCTLRNENDALGTPSSADQQTGEQNKMTTDTSTLTVPALIAEDPPAAPNVANRGQIPAWLNEIRENGEVGTFYRYPGTVTSPTVTSIRQGKYKGIVADEFAARSASTGVEGDNRKNLWVAYNGPEAAQAALEASEALEAGDED